MLLGTVVTLVGAPWLGAYLFGGGAAGLIRPDVVAKLMRWMDA